ncbi:UDP-N-acetylmuramoylalanine--D-glutamate ligase [invertebrate metagenome]|uniref:UDP-N-acetylmuramoylalanine--D-glutamate ligase n=1 Tax=invertebrate metagenome TaxID=1711999 RepID=A0A484H4W8_9ZZZZ
MIELSQYTGQTVAVMGFGQSGQATAQVLRSIEATVWIWDDDPVKRAEAMADGFRILDLTDVHWPDIACLVWSPGIPHTFPAPHPVAQRARAAGVVPVCDVELLMQSGLVARCVGITGTNGKSTTTSLITHILTSAGRSVETGGNLGPPVLALPQLGDEGIYVIELSSYQLELIPSLTLDIAVLLNIASDHIIRHGGISGYITAKSSIFAGLKRGGTAVISVDDVNSAALHESLPGRGLRVVPISVEKPKGVHVRDGFLWDHTNGGTTAVANLATAMALPGQHNQQNAAAAFATARVLGIKPSVIAAALQTFPGLAHRQELVAVIDGVRYVNDSKATNADAAEKAMTCYDTLYWIAGGQAKEGGITALAPFFSRVRHAFLIGEASPAFASTLEGHLPYTFCETLTTAVVYANRMATLERIPGAVVLLSPACASWDQFDDFEHRGSVFRRLVAALPGRRGGGHFIH